MSQSTNMQMGALLELDTNDPVDQSIIELVKLGLIECYYHDETGELGCSLTDKARKYLEEEEKISGIVDTDDFKTFLQASEKILDKIANE